MDQKPMLAVPVDLAQRIANYLQTKPFSEVAQFIGELTQCKPVDAPPAQAVMVHRDAVNPA